MNIIEIENTLFSDVKTLNGCDCFWPSFDLHIFYICYNLLRKGE